MEWVEINRVWADPSVVWNSESACTHPLTLTTKSSCPPFHSVNLLALEGDALVWGQQRERKASEKRQLMIGNAPRWKHLRNPDNDPYSLEPHVRISANSETPVDAVTHKKGPQTRYVVKVWHGKEWRVALHNSAIGLILTATNHNTYKALSHLLSCERTNKKKKDSEKKQRQKRGRGFTETKIAHCSISFY